MNRFLVFLVLSVASVSCVELENICSAGHFEYWDVKVNAFYRVKQNVTFESLAHYLIDRSIACDPTEFRNQSNLLEALKLRNHYNRKFSEFYTEELNATSVEEMAKKSDEVWSSWTPFFTLQRMESNVKCIEIFDDTAYSGAKVFVNLKSLTRSNECPSEDSADFKPTSEELIKTLGELFVQFLMGSDDQIFAFKGAVPRRVYLYRGIALLREFKFLKDDSGKVLPNTKAMLIFEQFLPFHNKKHTDENCVPVEELPLFFQEKGEEYRPPY